jgi:hypothetical protein
MSAFLLSKKMRSEFSQLEIDADSGEFQGIELQTKLQRLSELTEQLPIQIAKEEKTDLSNRFAVIVSKQKLTAL